MLILGLTWGRMMQYVPTHDGECLVLLGSLEQHGTEITSLQSNKNISYPHASTDLINYVYD